MTASTVAAPTVGLADAAERRRQLAVMRVRATVLLLVMTGVFVVARMAEEDGPTWVGYVRATAEAAMVGGLADWFAVTALFRHPLGLPIPHTAIIPRNKDRIGEALASFLKENFLIPPVVARRMRNIDVAGAVGRFLQAPEGQETRIRQGASRLLADLFESLDDERLGGLVKSAVSTRIKKMEVSPLLGHVNDGGRADREQLWAGLERTYREVRDFELMRLDVGRLVNRSGWRSGPSPSTNGVQR